MLSVALWRARAMVDIVDAAIRSKMMSGIKGKNTKPELVVRRYLHRSGFRYVLHRRDLPGRPDLTLPKYRAVIFVHGCFWHMHQGCRFATLPTTRPEFWLHKLEENRARDERQAQVLMGDGWRIAVVWECSLRLQPGPTLAGLSTFLKSCVRRAEFSADQCPKIE